VRGILWLVLLCSVDIDSLRLKNLDNIAKEDIMYRVVAGKFKDDEIISSLIDYDMHNLYASDLVKKVLMNLKFDEKRNLFNKKA